MSGAPTRFVHRRVAAFSETDAAGIVHFSNFFRWMEDCEHAFVRSLGISVHADLPDGAGYVGFPRVSASCDYLRPIRFEDEVEVTLTVQERRTRALRYGFELRVVGAAEPAAKGSTAVVCCEHRDGGGLVAIPLPAALQAVVVSPT